MQICPCVSVSLCVSHKGSSSPSALCEGFRFTAERGPDESTGCPRQTLIQCVLNRSQLQSAPLDHPPFVLWVLISGLSRSSVWPKVIWPDTMHVDTRFRQGFSLSLWELVNSAVPVWGGFCLWKELRQVVGWDLDSSSELNRKEEKEGG